MSVLLSGSMAYDNIMDFPDSFKNHILPDQIHILNVSFVVENLKKNVGGTAGNIAYTMKLLGGDPLILSPLGKDSEDYMRHLEKNSIDTSGIKICENTFTAAAHITTDKDDNQITAFYLGALTEADSLSVNDVKKEIELGILSPTKKEAMMLHAKECAEKNIPFVFDPGQQITTFNGQELMRTLGQAKFLIVNDYEMKLVEQKTGWTMEQILENVPFVIVTLGEKGSFIRSKDEVIEIVPCTAFTVQDPTGAGDAYRAGFFTAYTKGLPLETCGKVGSVAATYAIEEYGTQNHHFTLSEFGERYQKAYGEELKWN